jgi:hypothetical protein
MKYKPKSVAALHIALGGLPDKMRVQTDPDIPVSAKTVGQLRKVKAWPENLAVAVPQRLQGSGLHRRRLVRDSVARCPVCRAPLPTATFRTLILVLVGPPIILAILALVWFLVKLRCLPPERFVALHRLFVRENV